MTTVYIAYGKNKFDNDWEEALTTTHIVVHFWHLIRLHYKYTTVDGYIRS